MTDIITANKSALSFAINAIPRVKEICKPLTEYLGVSCFCYSRLYNNCAYIVLMNGHQEFQEKYYTNIRSRDPHFNSYLKSTPLNETRFFLWPTKYEKLYSMTQLYDAYDIWHGYHIIRRQKEYLEIFGFAFNKNTDSKAQFYIQNSRLLEKFCDYFIIKAADLISDNDKNKLASYQHKFDISYLEVADNNTQQFLSEISNLKNHSLINKSGNLIHLTPRESDCISILMQNRTMKEIGKLLDLSPRTVECHIENVKQKLEVNYKSQLVDIFSNVYRASNGAKL